MLHALNRHRMLLSDDRYINLLILLWATDSLPLSQLFAPANRHGIEWDHDYLEQPLSDKFLADINVTTITREEAEKIQMETLGQYNNKNWFRERRVRLHASNFGRICRVKDEQKLCADPLLYKKVESMAENLKV